MGTVTVWGIDLVAWRKEKWMQRQKRLGARDVDLTLDEIYFLMECANDYKDNPFYGGFAKSIAERLLSVWSYWSERTEDTASFTLRLRR